MKRALALIALLACAATTRAATDRFTVGSVTAPAGTVTVPVYVRDASGTVLGADKGAGKRIQALGFRVTFSPPGAVTSASFTRAGVLAGTPLFETSIPFANGLGYVASFAEGGATLPFTLDAAAPGQHIGDLTLTANGAQGSVVNILVDPVTTALSNQAGTVIESFPNTALELQGGMITLGACPAFGSASASIQGRASACFGGTGGTAHVSFSGGGASPTIQWGWRTSPNGATTPIGGATAASYPIDGHDFQGAATYYLVATVSNGCSQVVTSPLEIHITSAPDITLDASTQVYALSTENFASVEEQPSGATYNWSIANGTILSGQGTRAIRYEAGPSGVVSLSVTAYEPGCGGPATRMKDIAIINRPAGASTLYLLTPCRVYDSRGTTAITNGQERPITVAGACGVPAGAKAVAANITVIAPPTDGWLGAFPSDLPWPGTSTINYRANRTRANNAVIPLSSDGRMTLKNSGSTLHFIIDVTGYFK